MQKYNFFKIVLGFCLIGIIASGCASTNKLTGLENRVSKLEREKADRAEVGEINRDLTTKFVGATKDILLTNAQMKTFKFTKNDDSNCWESHIVNKIVENQKNLSGIQTKLSENQRNLKNQVDDHSWLIATNQEDIISLENRVSSLDDPDSKLYRSLYSLEKRIKKLPTADKLRKVNTTADERHTHEQWEEYNSHEYKEFKINFENEGNCELDPNQVLSGLVKPFSDRKNLLTDYVVVEIIGYTCTIGSNKRNKEIAKERILNSLNFLKKSGATIAPHLITKWGGYYDRCVLILFREK